MAWIDPTGYNLPDGGWGTVNNTGANQNWGAGWTTFVEWTHDAFYCSKVKFYCSVAGSSTGHLIDIDIYHDGEWHDLYSGEFTESIYIEKPFDTYYSLTKVRYRVYNNDASYHLIYIYVVGGFYALSIPVVAVYAPTNIDKEAGSARLNGEITDDGGWIDSYGFEYKKGAEGSISSIQVGDDSNQEITDFYYDISGLDNDIYYYRAWSSNIDVTGYSEWRELDLTITSVLINIKAEPDSTQGAIKLYGEITEGEGITEKGFEYIVQDEEPSSEDTGIECIKTKPAYQEYWEIGEYWAHENEGNDVAFEDMLYRLSREEEYEHTTIWWFRAYCKVGEVKYTAATWMKNVPSVSTFACTEEGAQQATGNGELTDKGANTVERLGFRIIKEYSGDLMGAQYYCNILSGYKVAEELEETTLYDKDGIYIVGFTWTGIFYRDAFFPKSETPGDFELGIYDYVLGGGFLGEEFGVYLKPNDTYKIQAIAKNDLGIGYGADDGIVTVNTGQNFLFEEDEPIISPTSAEKTVTIGDIPEGSVATRVGIRLGRTRGCNEIDVFMDGEWGNEEKVTFFITDLVPGKKYYEEPYMVLRYDDFEEEIIDDEEEEFEMEELEDEDLDDIIPTYEEYSYKTIIREIGCEKISDQSFIDKAGRRRSVTITNHLIQDRATCQEIIVDYLNKFQTIKLKVEIDYDIPIPFERQDAILIDDGLTLFKADGAGVTLFKADGAGEELMTTSILAKIRKMDGSFVSGAEIILNLELEV